MVVGRTGRVRDVEAWNDRAQKAVVRKGSAESHLQDRVQLLVAFAVQETRRFCPIRLVESRQTHPNRDVARRIFHVGDWCDRQHRLVVLATLP